MVLPSVVLPQPDSPTSARISPGAMSRLTPSTAVAVFRRPRPANCTRTSTAERMGALTAGATVAPAGLAAAALVAEEAGVASAAGVDGAPGGGGAPGAGGGAGGGGGAG